MGRVALVVLVAVAYGVGGGGSAAAAGGSGGSASNRAAAQRDADGLVARVVLPPGAVRLGGEPAGDNGYLKPLPALESDTAHALADVWWQVPGTPETAVAFIEAHRPAGATQFGSGSSASSQTGASASMVFFQWPAVGTVLGYRTVTVTATALSAGETGVLIESQSDWIVPRPTSERIPSAVARIDITSGAPRKRPPVSLSVTRAGQVRSIVRLINGLPIAQPVAIACPSLSDPRMITLRFRAASGRTLAVLTYDDFRPWSSPSVDCKTVGLSIGGRGQPPLLGGSFLSTLAKLVGRSLI